MGTRVERKERAKRKQADIIAALDEVFWRVANEPEGEDLALISAVDAVNREVIRRMKKSPQDAALVRRAYQRWGQLAREAVEALGPLMKGREATDGKEKPAD